jgi:murein DD-endopeptidase MepM/ murein hydrolase activator NlpD
MKRWLLVVLAGAFCVALAWVLIVKLEGEDPQLNLARSSLAFGSAQKLNGTVSDGKSGLRKLWIGVTQAGREHELLATVYPSAGLFGDGVPRTDFSVEFAPAELGLADGKALLRLAVWDRSWRGWGSGNRTYLEKEITIDTQPPRIEVLSRAHYINQGGAGLAVYRLSETCPHSGVAVGDNFFPGYSGHFDDGSIHLAFFAVSYTQGPQTRLHIEASDAAGNSTQAGLSYNIRARRFREDVLRLSDGFLNRKLPEFESALHKSAQASPLEQFLEVNRRLRRENYEKLTALGAQTAPVLQWAGQFLRLPRAATRARFADQRSYRYRDKIVDHQVHLGVDLASVEKSPVPAANSGTVVFAESVGIYGLTVLIDHGFGLMSMYSHLSRTDVQPGQTVARGDIIGATGQTGLAGGDHLHFGMMVHNTFVNPLEWWDQSWIENNITGKIQAIQASAG